MSAVISTVIGKLRGAARTVAGYLRVQVQDQPLLQPAPLIFPDISNQANQVSQTDPNTINKDALKNNAVPIEVRGLADQLFPAAQKILELKKTLEQQKLAGKTLTLEQAIAASNVVQRPNINITDFECSQESKSSEEVKETRDRTPSDSSHNEADAKSAYDNVIQIYKGYRDLLFTRYQFFISDNKSEQRHYHEYHYKLLEQPIEINEKLIEDENRKKANFSKMQLAIFDRATSFFNDRPFSQKLLDEKYEFLLSTLKKARHILKSCPSENARIVLENFEIDLDLHAREEAIASLKPFVSKAEEAFLEISHGTDMEILQKTTKLFSDTIEQFEKINELYKKRKNLLNKYPDLLPKNLMEMRTLSGSLSALKKAVPQFVSQHTPLKDIREAFLDLFNIHQTLLPTLKAVNSAVKVAKLKDKEKKKAADLPPKPTLILDNSSSNPKAPIHDASLTTPKDQPIESQQEKEDTQKQRELIQLERENELLQEHRLRKKQEIKDRKEEIEHQRILKEHARAERHLEMIMGTNKQHKKTPTTFVTSERDLFQSLYDLNPNNLNFLLAHYQSPIPHLKFRYQDLDNLFSTSPQSGKLHGSLAPTTGSHRKLTIKQTIGYCEGFDTDKQIQKPNENAFTCGDKKRAAEKGAQGNTAPLILSTSGGTFRPHQGESKLPAIILRQVVQVLIRAGYTAEVIERFKKANEALRIQNSSKPSFDEFYNIARALKDKDIDFGVSDFGDFGVRAKQATRKL